MSVASDYSATIKHTPEQPTCDFVTTQWRQFAVKSRDADFSSHAYSLKTRDPLQLSNVTTRMSENNPTINRTQTEAVTNPAAGTTILGCDTLLLATNCSFAEIPAKMHKHGI